MGEFVNGEFVPGSQGENLYAGTPAGARGHTTEPLARRDLHERAKQLVAPAGPRTGDPPPAPFDAWGSKGERRDLTRAAEFVAGMDGDHAQQYWRWLAGEQAELDATVGPAEDGREEQDEKLWLTLDLADRVDARTAELVEDQREFVAWATDQAGSQAELLRWLGQQDDQQAALHELAEEYIADLYATEQWAAWIADTFGDDALDRINELPDDARDEALSHLAESVCRRGRRRIRRRPRGLTIAARVVAACYRVQANGALARFQAAMPKLRSGRAPRGGLASDRPARINA